MRLNIADDRAVARAAHLEGHIALPFDADGFGAFLKRRPAGGRAVLAGLGCVQLFEVQVLNVRPRVGKAPGHTLGSAQHDKRQTGQSGSNHIQRGVLMTAGQFTSRRFQVCKIPDGRRTQGQVRIVGQQGFATDGVAARNHPIVAAFAFQNADIAHPVSRPLGQCVGRCCEREGLGLALGRIHAQLSVQGRQVHCGGRFFTRIRRKELPKLFVVEHFRGG